MPFDSWGSRLENQISETTEEWEALIQFVARYRNYYQSKTEHTEEQAAILDRLIKKLGSEKMSLMRQLEAHRRRDQELGIKY